MNETPIFMKVIYLIIILALGLFWTLKPKVVWELKHMFSVQNGEPTDISLFGIQAGGIMMIMIALIGTIILICCP